MQTTGLIEVGRFFCNAYAREFGTSDDDLVLYGGVIVFIKGFEAAPDAVLSFTMNVEGESRFCPYAETTDGKIIDIQKMIQAYQHHKYPKQLITMI